MKFISKKYLPRRTFLRSAGATVALPLLDAMIPALTPLAKAAAAAPVKRFVGVWHPHGAAPGYWSPVQAGSDFEFSYITKPLESFRDRLVLITGLDVPEAYSTEEEPGGNHARGAVFLSGARPRRNAVSPYLGVTLDQVIAQEFGNDTILPSIQLGVEDAGNYGNCNWGYSCAYTNSMSWISPTQPLPTEINPHVAFERLFGSGATPEERQLGRIRKASILDSVANEIPTLRRTLSADDKVRLDTYLENIRELERRIQIAIANPVEEPEAGIPFGIPQSKDVHFKLMFDLIALAFEGDITRSATMMLGVDITSANFPESGTNGAWHGTSHHGDKPENIAEYAKMNRYHVSILAYFLDQLRNIEEVDGNALDHSLVYMGSNMGNSHRHAHEKVPVILAGGLDGTFKGNRHIVFPDNTEKTSNMLLSLLHLYGIERSSFGQSTGLLPIV
ncbi:DUF1552 domain-containing protein [Gammaproteobacteria bacterium]|jgi:hypothetical protein|nr:DUF1552 domain-containing protein [Gammaproteobacteria bacterium]